MKNKGFYIFLIVFLSVIVLGLGALLVFGLTHKGFFGFGMGANNISGHLAFEKEYDLSEIDTVSVNVRAGEVKVHSVAGDMGKVTVKFFADNDDWAKVELDSKALKVEDDTPECHGFCFNQVGVLAELYLPVDYTGKLDIDIDYGKTKVENLSEATIRLDSSAGDVELGSAKNIDAKLSAGRLTVGDCYGRLNIENNMGDVEIEKLHLTEDSTVDLDMGDVEIREVGDVRVEADVDLGNRNVSGGNDAAAVVLRVKNNMGNISIR